MERRRVLLVSSAGGHWVQLSRLRQAFSDFDCHYATTIKGARAPSGPREVHYITDASRDNLLRLAFMYLKVMWLIIRIRPHFVVSTGAAPGLAALQIGKLIGARTVWIDSLANSEELSLAGVMAKRFADLWLTQWPHLTTKYPQLRYFGAVL